MKDPQIMIVTRIMYDEVPKEETDTSDETVYNVSTTKKMIFLDDILSVEDYLEGPLKDLNVCFIITKAETFCIEQSFEDTINDIHRRRKLEDKIDKMGLDT